MALAACEAGLIDSACAVFSLRGAHLGALLKALRQVGGGKSGPTRVNAEPHPRALEPTFAPAGNRSTDERRSDRDRTGERSTAGARTHRPPSRLPGRTDPDFLLGIRCGQVFGLREHSTCRRPTPHCFPAQGQCSSWVSFSLTAAGQPRNYAGFPFKAPSASSKPPTRPQPIGVTAHASTQYVGVHCTWIQISKIRLAQAPRREGCPIRASKAQPFTQPPPPPRRSSRTPGRTQPEKKERAKQRCHPRHDTLPYPSAL